MEPYFYIPVILLIMLVHAAYLLRCAIKDSRQNEEE